jgi:dipeptidyl aminopeptidase/acylaminoacyl peptidase
MCREIHARTGWSVLSPDFRGANLKENPRARQACASPVARQDVIDAVDAVIRRYALTPPAIFLRGGSGGAHMALMMAAYAPKLWTAVCAWCPVTDFSDRGIWAKFDRPGRRQADFREHVRVCCGTDIRSRAPIGHIDAVAQATVYLFHGKHDPALPFRTQSLAFYNKLIKRHPDAECYLSIFNGGHEARLDETLRVFEGYLSGKGPRRS